MGWIGEDFKWALQIDELGVNGCKRKHKGKSKDT